MRDLLLLFLVPVALFAGIFFGATECQGDSGSNQERLVTLATEAALKHNVDPNLVHAIITVESSWDVDAVGSLGEVGLMQMRPEFFPAVVDASLEEYLDIAVSYLAYVTERCEPRYGHASFICYNTGPFRRQSVKNPEQFPYYLKVIGVMQRG